MCGYKRVVLKHHGDVALCAAAQVVNGAVADLDFPLKYVFPSLRPCRKVVAFSATTFGPDQQRRTHRLFYFQIEVSSLWAKFAVRICLRFLKITELIASFLSNFGMT